MAFDALNKLNYRQRAFLTAYLSNGQDAPSAVIAAGYSEKGATQKGNSLLNTPAVKEAWAELSGELSKKQFEVIDELKDQFSDKIASIYEIQEFWTKLVRSNKDENGDYIKLDARIRASELLAKNMGMFIDKIEHSGKDGVDLPCITLNFIKSDTTINNG